MAPKRSRIGSIVEIIATTAVDEVAQFVRTSRPRWVIDIAVCQYSFHGLRVKTTFGGLAVIAIEEQPGVLVRDIIDVVLENDRKRFVLA